ncbi:hypothetical protein CKO28_17460 [Rhodovibrio sodomensis]|uniref:Uncharacterized protein n=1 Tax=Rhodovibrio sodomensis TaxID=1088 RepID=A0ABS1DH74_9PROT|nr:hypothetical protein [Rhodovibrio sodomensis]MBK1669826.1 hypothetical protein [Rhodovibrio sodomensis]
MSELRDVAENDLIETIEVEASAPAGRGRRRGAASEPALRTVATSRGVRDAVRAIREAMKVGDEQAVERAMEAWAAADRRVEVVRQSSLGEQLQRPELGFSRHGPGDPFIYHFCDSLCSKSERAKAAPSGDRALERIELAALTHSRMLERGATPHRLVNIVADREGGRKIVFRLDPGEAAFGDIKAALKEAGAKFDGGAKLWVLPESESSKALALADEWRFAEFHTLAMERCGAL